MRFWAIIFVLVTLWLAFFKVEDPVGEDDPDMDVKKVYKVMWSIVQLKSGSTVHNSRFTIHATPALFSR
jgi:PAT family acetyl-CoA transporter-like MFS transporter 1